MIIDYHILLKGVLLQNANECKKRFNACAEKSNCVCYEKS